MKRAPALLIACLLTGPAAAAVEDLLQMVDYVGVDYGVAVADGEVVDEFEFAEMQEFARRIRSGIVDLEPVPADDEIRTLAGRLDAAIEDKADPEQIASHARRLRQLLLANYDVVLTPAAPPDLERGARLYAARCASCHGAAGRGDGPAAAGLEPAPTDFTDSARARQRSLFSLFNTITLGVDGTAMTGFADLPAADRWALAWYVGGLYGAPGEPGTPPFELVEAVTLSPEELALRYGDGDRFALQTRLAPAPLFRQADSPVAVARQKLGQSIEAYRAGRSAEAEDLAVSAYLDGFELSEPALRNISAELMRATERAMSRYRYALTHGAPAAEIEQHYSAAMELLERSAEALGGPSMAPLLAFTGSLIILLREGVEAILVLAAMIAFLVRAGRRDALRYIHAGWIAALVLGVATWSLSVRLIQMSGATREITEGVATLTAAAILLYIGYWMHRNSNAARWNEFLRGKMEGAFSSGTLWTLCLVSFLAVYREIFETILFYQALWVQVDATAHVWIFGGAGLAVILLAAGAWAIFRLEKRLPLRQFFLFSAILMITLAIIFTGKGIYALQEANRIPVYPLPLPTIDLLGIYPTAQAITAQCLILVAAVVLFARERRRT